MMKQNNKLSIFMLQQKSSRPGATFVLTVFMLVYFLYLLTFLIINMRAGWIVQLKSEFENLTRSEVYTFEYYFNKYTYHYTFFYASVGQSETITTQFLIHSETVFFASLVAIVAALTLAHVKVNRGRDTINRLSISHRSVITFQWLSDCAYTLAVWLSHLIVILLVYVVFASLAPDELKYQNMLYTLFATERYLYLFFPVLNPLSLVRMLSMVLAISFLPSLISGIIDSVIEKHLIPRILISPAILIGLICWGCFSSGHIESLILCIIALLVGAFLCSAYLLREGDKNAE